MASKLISEMSKSELQALVLKNLLENFSYEERKGASIDTVSYDPDTGEIVIDKPSSGNSGIIMSVIHSKTGEMTDHVNNFRGVLNQLEADNEEVGEITIQQNGSIIFREDLISVGSTRSSSDIIQDALSVIGVLESTSLNSLDQITEEDSESNT